MSAETDVIEREITILARDFRNVSKALHYLSLALRAKRETDSIPSIREVEEGGPQDQPSLPGL